MELYTPLYIQFRRRELPDAAVQLLCSEACAGHGAQKVNPGNFSDVTCGSWCKGHGIEDFK